MSEPGAGSFLIIGVGSRDRGDDGVGPEIAGRFRARGVPALEIAGDCTRLLDAWEGYRRVVIVDAMRTGAPVGAVRTFDAAQEPLPKDSFNVSTHLFGLAAAIELARVLDRLPPALTVYGVEGQSFGVGSAMSKPVIDALDEVESGILRAVVS